MDDLVERVAREIQVRGLTTPYQCSLLSVSPAPLQNGFPAETSDCSTRNDLLFGRPNLGRKRFADE